MMMVWILKRAIMPKQRQLRVLQRATVTLLLLAGIGSMLFAPADDAGLPGWLYIAFGVFGFVCFFLAGMATRAWYRAMLHHRNFHDNM